MTAQTNPKRSIEILHHFQCGSCSKWWSIGDAPELPPPGSWHCPWCGRAQPNSAADVLETDIASVANELHQKYRTQPWFIAAGIGGQDDQGSIYLYVTSIKQARAADVPDAWGCYRVLLRRTTPARPASTPRL